MKYAVIKTGGKQYKVSEGQVIEVELLSTDGKSHIFEEVLLFVDGDKVELGMPTVSGIKVFADVIEEVKGDKIEVFKYKSKSRYRKHTGHRQKYTKLKVVSIGSKLVNAEPVAKIKTDAVKKVAKKATSAKPKAKAAKTAK